MGLEEIVKRVGSTALQTTVDFPVSIFLTSSRKRIYNRLFGPYTTTEPHLLEHVAHRTLSQIYIPLTAVAFIAEPKLLGLCALTKIGSYAYEKKNKKDTEESKQKKVIGSYLTRKKEGFKEWLRTFPRSFAVYSTSYAIMIGLAATHYGVREHFLKDEEFHSDEVTLRLAECEKDPQNFYLLGEEHQYNTSSSMALGAILREFEIDVAFGEGFSSPEEIPFGEQILYLGARPLFWGLGDPIFSDEEVETDSDSIIIPTLALEEPSESGLRREGLSPLMEVLLGAGGVFGLLFAPEMYFFGAGYSGFNVSYISAHEEISKYLPVSKIESQTTLIGTRNELMCSKTIEYMEEGSYENPLVGVGYAHKDGMIEIFEKDYGFTCEDLKLTFTEDQHQSQQDL